MKVGMSLIMRLRPAFRVAATWLDWLARVEVRSPMGVRAPMGVCFVLVVLGGQSALDTAGASCKLFRSAWLVIWAMGERPGTFAMYGVVR